MFNNRFPYIIQYSITIFLYYLIFNNCSKSSNRVTSLRTNQIYSFFKCLIFNECFVEYKWEALTASLSSHTSPLFALSSLTTHCTDVWDILLNKTLG